MNFSDALISGTLLRRYKRFLADVELGNGCRVTAHCANPGAMTGLSKPGLQVWLLHRPSPRRKLKYSWELVETEDGALVGVNTLNPNRIVHEALQSGCFLVSDLYDEILPERPYGNRSRVDFLLRGEGEPDFYVEVKNVHLVRDPGLAEFPDAVTARGRRHLNDLAEVARNGARATVLYVVQRADCLEFRVASDIDPAYAAAAAATRTAGVRSICFSCRVTLEGIELTDRLPEVT